MTNPPADLLAFRAQVMTLTGLTSPADVGIVGDGAHQRTGGYHEGVDVLTSIGRYHAPATAHVGASTEDYSCRSMRDRLGLTGSASAMDIGAAWPHGGRGAWIRFNNAFANALRAGDAALAAVRATNYSPDGALKWRIDREAGWRTESTSDPVDIHTHIEWYRDTEGRRGDSLNRIAQLIAQATGALAPGMSDDVSAHTDAVIDGWRQGNPKASDGTDIAPVAWRIADEKWQSTVTAALGKLSVGNVAPVDTNALAAALAANPAFAQAVAQAVTAQLRGTVDDVVEARLNGATATISTAGQH